MDISNVKELIKAVSDSDLTSFKYNEGNVSIVLGKNDAEIVSMTEVVTDGITADNHAADIVDKNIGVDTKAVDTNTIDTQDADATNNTGATNNNVGNLVKTPLVGTIYLAPGEGEEPFVKVGDRVEKGQVLAIVEAMKLMNEIECEYDGVVQEVLVGNGEVVEYGQPLFRV